MSTRTAAMATLLHGSVPVLDGSASASFASRIAASPYAQPLVRTAAPKPRPQSAAAAAAASMRPGGDPRMAAARHDNDGDGDDDEFEAAIHRATQQRAAEVRARREMVVF